MAHGADELLGPRDEQLLVVAVDARRGTFVQRHAVLHEEPMPLDEARPHAVPPRLQVILDRTLQKDPKDRYQTVSELIVDLDSLLRPVFGHQKQGASFGFTKIAGKQVLRRGLSPLVATLSTEHGAPVIAGVRLRADGLKDRDPLRRDPQPRLAQGVGSGGHSANQPPLPGTSQLLAAGGQGQSHPEGGSLVRRGVDLDPAAVGGDGCGHDRQAEPTAGAGASQEDIGRLSSRSWSRGQPSPDARGLRAGSGTSGVASRRFDGQQYNPLREDDNHASLLCDCANA